MPTSDEGEREVETDRESGEGRWKAREQQHDAEDQPDVIGFPNGADRVCDRFALLRAARTAGECVPNAAAEIGAAENRVERDRQQRNECDKHFGGHAATRGTPARGGGSGAGGRGNPRQQQDEASRRGKRTSSVKP